MEGLAMDFASSAIGKVGEMVVQQIANEASMVCNFKQDFKWLEKKGKQISGFLQDADTQSTSKEAAKQWIRDVRDIAFRTEDILEEYQVESLYRSNRIRCQSCWCSRRELVFRYKMGRRIRDIKGQMRSLAADAQQMNLLYAASTLQQQPASTSTSVTEAWRKSSLMERDSRPVAIDEKVEDILSLLANASVSVIAVVGMGGVGKTFLLQNVYSKAKSMFQESIWLSISRSYSIPQLQIDLASNIGLKNEVSGVSEVRVQELIHERLTGAKSLIVLDDVWRASQEDDLIANLGLPVGNNSECKVIVTTRSREVCRSMNAHLYQMECLSEEDSWTLFCAYAFPNTRENTQPADLEQIAREVARECARLPLAIKIVASSMAQTTVFREWEEKLRHLKEVNVGNLRDPVMQILKLSYDMLPTSLKPCFAYFSFFPEDELIDCEYLVYLWMGEGFISDADMGWDYLRQFVNLCLVEVWDKHNWQDIYSLKLCKLHDLVFDLAVSISKENRCVFRKEEVKQSGCLHVLLGRQGLHDDAIADSNFSCPPFVRTLSLFKNSNLENIPAKLFSQLRVLRVLDLSHTVLSSLPESVENLKLLRVLNLSNTSIKQLPKCVTKLKSIRFLDVSDTHLDEVPAWIGQLTSLQHLNIMCSKLRDRIPPKGISKLLSLSTLRSYRLELAVEENESLKLKDLANLSQLRQLEIKVKHQEEMRMLEKGILEHMVHMRVLKIWNGIANEAEQIPFPFIPFVETMKDLEHLFLSNFTLTSRIHGFANLRILQLQNCSDYSAHSLETMPNLTTLSLEGNETCSELPEAFGKSRAFPKLCCLYINKFYVLEEFWEELEDGAMAGLETLRIESCPKIKNVPKGLEGLKFLKELEFLESGTDEIRERLKEGGEECKKIKAKNRHVRISVR